MKIQLKYGEEEVQLDLDDTKVAWVASPRSLEISQAPEELIAAAIDNPIGMAGLADLPEATKGNVVLLVDDNTRSTPQRIILPILLDKLNRAGVSDSSITALICTGTHRPMTGPEMRERYGAEATGRIKFVNHDCHDESRLVATGIMLKGVPVKVNRVYAEAGFSIAVGNIVPHMNAGWAGGAKMIQPGLCGAEITAETHYLAARQVNAILGNIDNEVRQMIDEIGVKTGLGMIVNTILDANHQIVGVVAGEPIAAHRAGVRIAEKVFKVQIDRPCDLVIASAYPADLDFWQSVKALNNCAMAVRSGGVLVLLAADPEGIANSHPDLAKLGTRDAAAADQAYASGEISDKIALSSYLALELNRRRVNTILVSKGISAEAAGGIGLGWAPDLDQAVKMGMQMTGGDCRIGVVTHGADLYFAIG